jgi:hypothetical protein
MESIAMRKTVNIAHIVERANTYFQVSKPDQREARRMLQSFVESILHEAKAYHGFRYLTADDMPESFPPALSTARKARIISTPTTRESDSIADDCLLRRANAPRLSIWTTALTGSATHGRKTMGYLYQRDYGTFCLECWDNGLAYALTHKPSNRSVYVQGDDALQFERDREAAEIAFPDKTDDEIMAWLWDQCDYGSASKANEESP